MFVFCEDYFMAVRLLVPPLPTSIEVLIFCFAFFVSFLQFPFFSFLFEINCCFETLKVHFFHFSHYLYLRDIFLLFNVFAYNPL